MKFPKTIARPSWTSIPSHLLTHRTTNLPLARTFSTTTRVRFSTDTSSSSSIKPKTSPEPSARHATSNAQSPSNTKAPSLPHLHPQTSEAHMISITHKLPTHRTSTAFGTVFFSNASPHDLISQASMKKGDVLAVSRVAGIMAAKRTAEIIPLCHPGVGIEGVDVRLRLCPAAVESKGGDGDAHAHAGEWDWEEVDEGRNGNLTENGKADMMHDQASIAEPDGLGSHGGISIQVRVECSGKTGVEMEALTGVMGAALSVVDMCKGVDKGLRIEGVRVVEKTGGRSGSWREVGWKVDEDIV
ncbi:hypothetical protein MMC25_003969 [Agyrium rufum]|nr:hypothetical protein [Agyrium rufum]